MSADPLTIGYLQVGPPEHGICRHGRLLATEGRRRSDVTVIERNIRLSGERRADRHQLAAAAAELASADLVHLQVSVAGDTTWGRNRRSIANLRVFRRHSRVPMVVTLHDVNNLRGLGPAHAGVLLRRAVTELARIPLRPAVRLLRQLQQGRIRVGDAFRSLTHFDLLYAYIVARWVSRRAQKLLVASGGEAATLGAFGLGGTVTMVPLPVEDARVIDRVAAPGLDARQTVVVAGFIFQSKGYDLMIEALARLPDIELVLVGGPRLGTAGSRTASRLIALAGEKGVADRVRITGYLPDEEYHRRLAAADLAVCPFDPDKSASASLSSLIAAGCPILASDTPLIGEYNALAPGALATFSPYTPEALALAILEQLRKPRTERTRGLGELRERLSIREIYDRHLDAYRQVLA